MPITLLGYVFVFLLFYNLGLFLSVWLVRKMWGIWRDLEGLNVGFVVWELEEKGLFRFFPPFLIFYDVGFPCLFGW